MAELLELARYGTTSVAALEFICLVALGYAYRDQIRHQRERDEKRFELDIKRAEQAALHQAAIGTLQTAIDRLAERIGR